MKPILIVTLMLLGLAGCESKKPAAAPDGKLFALEAEALPAQLASGAAGKVQIRIKLKDGEISPEAPFDVALTPRNLKLQKDKLGYEDVEAKTDGVTISIPFTAGAPGPAAVDADLDFRVCVEKPVATCVRQTDKVSVPVTVQ